MALITNPGPELLETKSYPFQRVRHMLEHMVPQEGVWGPGEYKVSQRAAGANMSVDVAAGSAWVRGDTGTRQGLYHQVNDGAVNLAVPPAHATLPRIDQVILRIFDSTVAGGSDLPVLEVLPGTPSSGAQVANPGGANYRLGAAALPNDAIRFADLGVTPAAAAITNAMIVDRRASARGAFWPTTRSAGDYSTASAVMAAIDANNLSPRIECSGGLVVVTLSPGYVSGASGEIALFIDGAEPVPAQRKLITAPGTNIPATLEWRVQPAAGSHVFQPRFASSSGTLFLGADANRALTMEVSEDTRRSL